MDQSWINFIESESKKDYFIKLKEFITERRKISKVIPEPKNVFLPFETCRYQMLKVVIIGGEPYPNNTHAHGLAFSSKSKETPTALKYIKEEIFNDFYKGNTEYVKPFKHNDLSQWAEQGVLLLNSILTTEENLPGTHIKKGWEEFTENLIKLISSDHPNRLSFLLWGKAAKQYSPLINEKKHLILESEHPSSAKHSQNNWYSNKHFSKANDWITKHYFGQRMTINWGIW